MLRPIEDNSSAPYCLGTDEILLMDAKMKSRFFALISGLLTMTGCVDPNAPIKTRAGKLTQMQVDAIVHSCGGNPEMVRIENDDLIIYPAKDLSVTGCVLKALQATGQTTLSRVENQRHNPPESQ